jgi:hypothetical protein
MTGSRFRLSGLALLAAVAGCGPRVGTVTGTVTFDGQKLEAGTVTFFGPNGEVLRKSAIALDGTYKVEDIPVGPVVITVATTPPPPAMGGRNPNLPPPPAGMPVADPNVPRTSVLPQVGKYTPIPERYKRMQDSGLGCTVHAGTQTHDIPLTPP